MHESLHQKIVELTEEIHLATSRITTLENQWAQLRNSQKSTATSTSTNRNLNQQRIPLAGKSIPPPIPNSTRPSNRRPTTVPHAPTPKQHRVTQTGKLLEQEKIIKEEINHRPQQSNKNRKNVLHQNTQDLNVKLLFHLNTVPKPRHCYPRPRPS
jgi:hypothetical protein